MRVIPLTQGQITIVSNVDYERLLKYKWYACRSGTTYYAATKVWNKQTRQYSTIRMHKIIKNLWFNNKQRIDHINHDTLDNRRSNLRMCTHQQNIFNTKAQTNCSSKYKGVCWDKNKGLWLARLFISGKFVLQKRFRYEIEAKYAYDKAALKYQKSFMYKDYI